MENPPFSINLALSEAEERKHMLKSIPIQENI